MNKQVETANLVVVSIADMKVSNNPSDMLVTYSLGSCLGITIYDPIARVGGMIHCMLPAANLSKDKARENPFMFVDIGVPTLFKEAYKHGADKKNIIIKVAGGAQILDSKGLFNIGKRNYTILRKILWHNGVMIESEDVGGMCSRTLYLSINTGWVGVKSNGLINDL